MFAFVAIFILNGNLLPALGAGFAAGLGAPAVLVVIVGLLVWTVFLLTTTLTERPEAGGVAALIVALIPDQLRWSHSAAAEPSASGRRKSGAASPTYEPGAVQMFGTRVPT